NVLEDRGPRPDEATRERIRQRLLEVRARRKRPGLDDKRLTSWNALMIAALAEAGAQVDHSPGTEAHTAECIAGQVQSIATGFLDAAVACAEFVLRELRTPQGRLLRTYSEGRAKIDAYLEDYAFLLEALIALFEATCDERWLEEATTLGDQLIERFSDPEHGGFFSTATDSEQLISRRKELEDSPIPAGGSSAAMGLLRLAQLTGEERYERHGASVIALLHTIAPRHPASFGYLLQAMHWRMAPPRPVACAVPGSAPLSARPGP
ncbi:MAG TPA: glycoside hydrolase family 47 protein, partial [Solirubrobacteraceae bacterium]